MTSLKNTTSRKPVLRLVVPSRPEPEVSGGLECVSVLRLTGLRLGQRDDPVPSAWRDILALLWSSTAQPTEMVEIVHEVRRSVDGLPRSYGQWIRLWQAPSARPSPTRSAFAAAIRSVVPRLAFEECPGDLPDESGWSPEAHLVPEMVKVVTPQQLGAPSVQGSWPHPGQLPNWKLSVPVDEPLCESLRVHCRFTSAELSDEERENARSLLKFLASGHARVLHPDAVIDLANHHPVLAAQLAERLQAWVRESAKGFRFDAVISTPVGQGLSTYALRRVAHDLFGVMPCRTTLLDDDVPLSPGLPSLPLLHEQGLPACFIATTRLADAFGVSELSEAPKRLPAGPGAVIGVVGGCDLTLPHSQAASHLLVVGGSGVGKSSALTRLLQQDIEQGLGVGLIDPHGELADHLLKLVPASRRQDVIWVDVDDAGCSAAINPMEGTKDDPAARGFVSAQLVHLIKNNGETINTWGPAAENHLRQCFLLAMCHPQGGTICDAARLLEDDGFCDWLLSKNKDISLGNHFKHWRNSRSEQGYDSWRPWLLARLHPFTKSMPMLRMLQRPSTINVGQAMDESKIVIFRLGKSVLSELECQLLGTTLLLEFHRAALKRSRKPADQRPLFRLVVDEFQTFASDATPGLFREARKYNLGLVVATQSLSSLANHTVTHLKDAVLANTATKLIFRVSPVDANVLDDYTLPEFSCADLVRTRNFEAVLCMSAGDVPPMRIRLHRPLNRSEPGPHMAELKQQQAVQQDLGKLVDEFLRKRHELAS